MKRIYTILIVLFLGLSIFAQDTIPTNRQQAHKQKKTKRPIGQKLYFGGGVGLTFGTYTRIALYPIVGYKITRNLSLGVELGYEYIRDNRYSESIDASNYGASIFARYRIIPQLFVHAEYAIYNYELFYVDLSSERVWVPFLFLGAGFSQQIAPRTFLIASVKFDVLQNPNSPYSNWSPFWNIGISYGF
jgi:hypothetical protein